MEKSEIKAFIAKRCAKELKDGDVVNLGIGLPTMIPSYLPEGVELIIHAELGIVSAGATPKEGDANYDPYHVIDAGGGAIVITSSVTGDMVADPGEVAYATTKAALIGFTKALARELAPKNIRVNCICPGYIRTPLVDGMAEQSDPENPERAIDAIAAAVPLGRLGTPEECGELCAFLASDESSYLTGTQVVIDGGSTLPETSSMGQ